MSDTAAAEDDALDRRLEIEAGLRSAITGAVESAKGEVRVAEETNRASGRSGTEYQEAEAWTYEDPSPGYGSRR